MPFLPSETALTIVPQPPPPGLYVTLGPPLLVGWALEQLAKTLVFPARIIWVDGANAFNAYGIAMAARSVLKDPVQTLRSFQVARPFTAYQLEAMVTEKILPVARCTPSLLSVIADPLSLFADAEGRDTQVRRCYRRFISGLQTLAKETAVLVLSPAQASRYRESLIRPATRLTQLQWTKNGPALSLVPPRQVLAHR